MKKIESSNFLIWIGGPSTLQIRVKSVFHTVTTLVQQLFHPIFLPLVPGKPITGQGGPTRALPRIAYAITYDSYFHHHSGDQILSLKKRNPTTNDAMDFTGRKRPGLSKIAAICAERNHLA
ncbi:MAG TPA: hypothetical protein VMI35_02015 [Puia sp.]|nr:hypothetical protein [Puia sp.]